MDRLADRLRTARHVRRAVLLALDRAHDAQGNPTDHMQGYTVPDADVRAWCEEAPDLFLYGASVHPHRPGALDALERAAAQGAVLVKPPRAGTNRISASLQNWACRCCVIPAPSGCCRRGVRPGVILRGCVRRWTRG
jgi:mannonate dehydratase